MLKKSTNPEVLVCHGGGLPQMTGIYLKIFENCDTNFHVEFDIVIKFYFFQWTPDDEKSLSVLRAVHGSDVTNIGRAMRHSMIHIQKRLSKIEGNLPLMQQLQNESDLSEDILPDSPKEISLEMVNMDDEKVISNFTTTTSNKKKNKYSDFSSSWFSRGAKVSPMLSEPLLKYE